MKTLPSIKEMIQGEVKFQYYRDGELWYETANGFPFPIPVHDKKEVGNATFNRNDKGIFFMRYIRKYRQELQNAELNDSNTNSNSST